MNVFFFFFSNGLFLLALQTPFRRIVIMLHFWYHALKHLQVWDNQPRRYFSNIFYLILICKDDQMFASVCNVSQAITTLLSESETVCPSYPSGKPCSIFRWPKRICRTCSISHSGLFATSEPWTPFSPLRQLHALWTAQTITLLWCF